MFLHTISSASHGAIPTFNQQHRTSNSLMNYQVVNCVILPRITNVALSDFIVFAVKSQVIKQFHEPVILDATWMSILNICNISHAEFWGLLVPAADFVLHTLGTSINFFGTIFAENLITAWVAANNWLVPGELSTKSTVIWKIILGNGRLLKVNFLVLVFRFKCVYINILWKELGLNCLDFFFVLY